MPDNNLTINYTFDSVAFHRDLNAVILDYTRTGVMNLDSLLDDNSILGYMKLDCSEPKVRRNYTYRECFKKMEEIECY